MMEAAEHEERPCYDRPLHTLGPGHHHEGSNGKHCGESTL